jgi:glutamine cyclotransferase
MKLNKLLMVALMASCLFTACNNGDNNKTSETAANDANTVMPVSIPLQVVNVYPHDAACFTEGLEFIDGYLYESCGEYDKSDVRKTDITSGKVLQRTPMEKQYFGEGITVLNGKLYQLTYREKTGFVYDLKSLKPIKKFSFNTAEGWGMTNDGTHIIFDDGTNNIYYLDTASLQPVKQLSVSDEHGPVENINELEFIKGFLYVNQWQTEWILKIDTATGKVVARADMSELRQKLGISGYPPARMGAPDVLNGIAYDKATNRIFVTGKFWPKLVEVKLDN